MSKEVIEEKMENSDEKAIIKSEKKIKKRISEKAIISIIVIVILLVAFGIFGYYFYATDMVPIAQYDGGKVTKSEFNVYYKTFQPMLTYFGYPEEMISEQVANKVALDKIIIKEAKKEGVQIPEDRKKEIDEQFKDKTQLSQLTEQGINPTQLKQLYYDDAIISAYIDKKVKDLSDEEVIKYITDKANESSIEADLNSYETSHILFKTTSDSTTALTDEEKAAKKAKAEDTLKRLQSGEDFATLAKELSEDTGTKEDGGNYVVYMDGQTDEKYADAVKNMKPGDIVIVESSFGYHVIKLNSITENGRAKNEADREDCVNEKINKISTEKNFKINEENLKKVVEELNGNKTSDSTNNETTDTTNTTDNSTNTETENTTAGE